MSILRPASIATLLSLVCVNSALAAIPPQCPGAKDIQAQADSNKITCEKGECTFDLEKHRYDTELYWHFFMKIKSDNIEDAQKKAKDAMESLAFQSGPTAETSDLYFCRYSNASGYEAIAAYSTDEELNMAISR